MGGPGSFSEIEYQLQLQCFLDMDESDTCLKGKLLHACSPRICCCNSNFRISQACLQVCFRCDGVSLSSSAIIFLLKLNYLVLSELIGSVTDLQKSFRLGKTIYHFCVMFLFHEKNDSIILILHRGKGRQEKKETEAEAIVQHLCCSHKVILLFKRSFLSWFSFHFALFCCYSLSI